MGVTLVIASIEDGKLTGTGTYHAGPCRGYYPLVGSLKDNAIGVAKRDAKAERAETAGLASKEKLKGIGWSAIWESIEVVLQK